jgi:transposase-like protein
MTRSKHSEDFKKNAVRLVLRDNLTTRQVAENLVVNNWTLIKKWGQVFK